MKAKTENERRAQKAEKALRGYQERRKGTGNGTDTEHAVTDLLTDLMHLSHQKMFFTDFTELLRIALRHYHAEKE